MSYAALMEAREKMLKASLRVLGSQIDTEPHAHAGDEAEYAEEQLLIAARDLVRAVNGSREYPVGWFDQAL